jgi:hypothetical protein
MQTNSLSKINSNSIFEHDTLSLGPMSWRAGMQMASCEIN